MQQSQSPPRCATHPPTAPPDVPPLFGIMHDIYKEQNGLLWMELRDVCCVVQAVDKRK